jgi:hypothetical protein
MDWELDTEDRDNTRIHCNLSSFSSSLWLDRPEHGWLSRSSGLRLWKEQVIQVWSNSVFYWV